MTKTITITITEEVKKERRPLYVAKISRPGCPIVEFSTSKKRLEKYMKESKKYKGIPWWIVEVKNI